MFPAVSSHSANSLFPASISMELTGEFTSLEEPSDDSDIVSILDLVADGPDVTESERRIEPSDPTRNFRLPIVKSIS
jgi:hypothetical protein